MEKIWASSMVIDYDNIGSNSDIKIVFDELASEGILPIKKNIDGKPSLLKL